MRHATVRVNASRLATKNLWYATTADVYGITLGDILAHIHHRATLTTIARFFHALSHNYLLVLRFLRWISLLAVAIAMLSGVPARNMALAIEAAFLAFAGESDLLWRLRNELAVQGIQ
jgi:hypothetical protein